MRIAVTGGSGMVGRNLQDVVQNETDEYVFLTRNHFDCEDRAATLAHFEREKYDAIVHLAACVGGLYMHIDNNQQGYARNKTINDNVIDACAASGVRRGVFCSSSCVFPPAPPKFPMNEAMHLLGDPHPTNHGYARAKREMYERCREMNARGFDYLCLIPVNLYGKYDNFDLEKGHFLPVLMNRFHAAKGAGAPLVAYGDGTPLRQLLYARDFSEIILRFVAANGALTERFESVIVCDDEERTIGGIVERLAAAMGLDHERVVWDASRANGCMRKTVTNARLKGALDVAFTPLDEGLRQTYEWFQSNIGDART